jgi:hypothetical protein
VLRELSRYGTPKDYQRHRAEAYYVLRKQAGLAGLGGGGRFFMETNQLAITNITIGSNSVCTRI